MKRLLLTLTAVLCLSLSFSQTSSAQTWFLGGDFTAFYVKDFKFSTGILGGYEFNDKIAVAGKIGPEVYAPEDYDSITSLRTGVYFRFTPWHNDFVFLDLTYRTEAIFYEGVDAADTGLLGQIRFRPAEHIDVFANFFCAGARYNGDEWRPCIGFNTEDTSLGIIFRF